MKSIDFKKIELNKAFWGSNKKLFTKVGKMKILVVRFKQIGDAVLSSVICSSLKKSFPDSEIDYVIYEQIAPLFEKHKHIDNIISISKEEQRNPFKYLWKVWKVTRKKYDIVIDVMSTPKSEFFSLFSLGSGYRIGRKKKNRGYFYTHKIVEDKNAKDKVEKFLKMLVPLEEKYSIVYDRNYTINITEEEKKYMREKMKNAGIDFSKSIFICAANSRRPSKVYAPNKMKQVIERVERELNGQIILFYSKDEKEFIKKLHKELGEEKKIFSNIETKSIRELAMLIANCDFFFGNKGGPRHIAQSLDIPSFAIFSPSASKKEWLANANDRHHGVEPKDIDANCKNLSREERYNLIMPDYIFKKVEEMSKKYIKKEIK